MVIRINIASIARNRISWPIINTSTNISRRHINSNSRNHHSKDYNHLFLQDQGLNGLTK